MKSPAQFFESIKNSLFEKYAHDAGKMLLHTGTIAWIVSAIAQMWGIAKNDKLTPDEKKFLIPQEAFDAGINILSFYILTNSIQKFTHKFATSGKIIKSGIKEFCEKEGIAFGNWKENNIGKVLSSKIDEMTSKIKDYETTKNVIKSNNLEHGADVFETINNQIKNCQAIKETYEGKRQEYEKFASGCKVVGNIAGAVVSSNIITPLLRNPLAARRQKAAIEKEQRQSQITTPYVSTTTVQYPQKINSGSMKV